jgi:hypothetical protein
MTILMTTTNSVEEERSLLRIICNISKPDIQ